MIVVGLWLLRKYNVCANEIHCNLNRFNFYSCANTYARTNSKFTRFFSVPSLRQKVWNQLDYDLQAHLEFGLKKQYSAQNKMLKYSPSHCLAKTLRLFIEYPNTPLQLDQSIKSLNLLIHKLSPMIFRSICKSIYFWLVKQCLG